MLGHAAIKLIKVGFGERLACDQQEDFIFPVDVAAIAFEKAAQHIAERFGIGRAVPAGEAFELFALMQSRIRNDVTRILMTVRVESAEQAQAAEQQLAPAEYANVSYAHADFSEAVESAGSTADAEQIALALQQAPAADDSAQQPFKRYGRKIGRNDPCPCGSGRKYKACHGRLA